ncbi:MAG: 50S ribosomal protein L3 [Epsilonproteobacteria bacterium]|nr:50S ribosomal protein L3 [Campylobacterota bacterium]
MEYIVEKIGMSRTVTVPSVPVTLLKVVEAKVCEVNADKKAIVAYASGKKMNRSIAGKQKKYNLSTQFNRFVTLDVASEEAGDLDISALNDVKVIKATFTSKGRGFAGVMKRYNFKGGPGGHGSRFHRTTGSIGNAEWPGRVQKGRRMPGHYGNATTTVKNEVVSFDAQNSILAVKGPIPGANGALGRVRIVK